MGLYKTTQFKDPIYIGDPINAIRIFNEKEVDELLLLDIDATTKGKEPNITLISEIASECFMPLSYGGGIKNIDQITSLFQVGIEKVVLSSLAYDKPDLIREAVKRFGSQSIVVCMDVKPGYFGNYSVYSHNGTRKLKVNILEYAKRLEQTGIGELIISSIDKDGTMTGYDLNVLQYISNEVNIPVVACGGAGNICDFKKAIDAGASAVAAGASFVFHGKRRGVLISYPERKELINLFNYYQ